MGCILRQLGVRPTHAHQLELDITPVQGRAGRRQYGTLETQHWANHGHSRPLCPQACLPLVLACCSALPSMIRRGCCAMRPCGLPSHLTPPACPPTPHPPKESVFSRAAAHALATSVLEVGALVQDARLRGAQVFMVIGRPALQADGNSMQLLGAESAGVGRGMAWKTSWHRVSTSHAHTTKRPGVTRPCQG